LGTGEQPASPAHPSPFPGRHSLQSLSHSVVIQPYTSAPSSWRKPAAHGRWWEERSYSRSQCGFGTLAELHRSLLRCWGAPGAGLWFYRPWLSSAPARALVTAASCSAPSRLHRHRGLVLAVEPSFLPAFAELCCICPRSSPCRGVPQLSISEGHLHRQR